MENDEKRRVMLQKMHIDDPKYRGLLREFSIFYNKLDDDQKRVMRKSMLSPAACAATFGSDFTPADLDALCDGDGVPGVCGCTAANGAPIS